MEKRENFGRYIKEKRKAAGLSQKELATQLFVSHWLPVCVKSYMCQSMSC